MSHVEQEMASCTAVAIMGLEVTLSTVHEPAVLEAAITLAAEESCEQLELEGNCLLEQDGCMNVEFSFGDGCDSENSDAGPDNPFMVRRASLWM